MMLKLFAASCLVLAAGALTPAAAEIVYLTSGRTVNVAGHRFEGDMVVLALRSGGEMVMSRALVARVAPDEVPWIDPRAAAPVVAPKAAPALEAPAQFEALITQAAETHAVDPNLVRAVIKVESAWKPKARSHKGAMGLMQLMPATAREYGVRNAYDPAENINAGVKHLRSLLNRFDVRLALAAYNAGAGAVERYGGIPPYRETREYVKKVLSLAGQ
ncbi:MAG TPA: lytic transglycosylase domain-containing protein [Vicinamibacterales bacterium]|nr:lytic transglycosylase domain-containing protein [Vicinamibacterales bacterium]